MEMDWNSSESAVLLNPRMPADTRSRIEAFISTQSMFPGHIWLSTSGSSGKLKIAGLSKKALLASASAVNEHFQSNSSDVWLNPLPHFHVGGLGIMARSYLSGARVNLFNEKWDAHAFHRCMHASQATLTALVSAQVYDLVFHGLQAPSCLKATIVGGGGISEKLYLQGNVLGWKLHPSYGLTECCSQVATADLSNSEASCSKLRLLNHVEVKIDEYRCICLKSPALLSCYAIQEAKEFCFVDPKVNGWFYTEDKGELFLPYLNVFGRNTDFVKIGGESVDLGQLEMIFETAKLKMKLQVDAVLITVPDSRLGHAIHVAATSSNGLQILIDEFHCYVLPFERIRKVHYVDVIPRSSLNKVLKTELLSKLVHTP